MAKLAKPFLYLVALDQGLEGSSIRGVAIVLTGKLKGLIGLECVCLVHCGRHDI